MQTGIENHVTYYPCLARYLGSVNAAVLLSVFMSYRGVASDTIGIHKTALELYDESGLSYEAQRTARSILRRAGLLIETPRRLEHKIFFRVDEQILRRVLADGQHPPELRSVDVMKLGDSRRNGGSPFRTIDEMSNRPGESAEPLLHPVSRHPRTGAVEVASVADAAGVGRRWRDDEANGTSDAVIAAEVRKLCGEGVDWSALLIALGRAGYTSSRLRKITRLSHSTLMSWKNNGSEPGHAKGELLVSCWLVLSGCSRHDLPRRQPRLSAAKVEPKRLR